MRDLPISTATLVTTGQLISQGHRLDGRALSESREMSFLFPPSRRTANGCKGGRCIASLGGTKVLATVSLDVTEPHPRRPTQGSLFVHLDKSPLPSSGPSSIGSIHVRLQDILKQCLRDCLDLDPLCIVAGERVFCIRLQLRILCNAGNVLDCAAMAALIALATFRRPDITMGPDRQVIINYDWSQHDPVPLTFRKFPFIMTLGCLSSSNSGATGGGQIGILMDGKRDERRQLAPQFLIDPTLSEEAILSGRLVIGLNIHRELCCLHTLESSLLAVDKILRAVKVAEKRVKGLHYIFKQALKAYDANDLSPTISKDLPVCFASTDLIDTSLYEESIKAVKEEKRIPDYVIPAGYEPTGGDDMDISPDEDEGLPETYKLTDEKNFLVTELHTKAPIKAPVWQATPSSADLLESEESAVVEYDPTAVMPLLDESEEEGEVVEY